ncbi:MAG TPA: glycosyltransferase family 4 protein [Cytophagaceae bacterium]|jgi:glycosyltransferase involved in cell wall biosynthesis|nr:glycosyltransferase family 4 protein [Cytophagaceae bacterium]
MKILIVHNKYKIAGGEDIQTEEEILLLKQNGVDVHSFYVSNDSVDDIPNVKLAYNTIWSEKHYKILFQKIKTEKFDIVHVQNFFPLLSPSIFYAAKKAGAKVIMTTHNYRLICPNALMFIENKICNSCLGKTVPYPALFKKCYRDSFSATAATVAMLSFHNFVNTWEKQVDGFICISNFVKKQLILGGFKEAQLHVKYNFVSPNLTPDFEPEDYYVFVGRTSNQKGIDLLLNTFQGTQKRIIIIGDGPLNSMVKEFAERNSNIQFLGKLSLEETYKKIAKAKALVCPSHSNEPFGRTIAEAFAHGTPVIGSSLGGITELVKEGINGFLFDPFQKSDLLKALDKFEKIEDKDSLRKRAYASYLENFTPSINYRRIVEIYKQILNN